MNFEELASDARACAYRRDCDDRPGLSPVRHPSAIWFYSGVKFLWVRVPMVRSAPINNSIKIGELEGASIAISVYDSRKPGCGTTCSLEALSP